jgi:hypothetical protein
MTALKGGMWRVKMNEGDPDAMGKWTCTKKSGGNYGYKSGNNRYLRASWTGWVD